MEKLKMHTPNLTAENIEKLAALFPNCVTEARDEKGKLTKAIDFDQLRQELSDHIVDGPRERYHLDWPGKREALLAANAPIAKTLRPCREESVNFDTTKNLFIEGDNLDALKLLQETYLGKVKIIYIDPPYNTGSDLLYHDNFRSDADSYLRESNQLDESGNRLTVNTETNGRFHSDWLKMFYPRLKLAKNLLRDDGVIMISIDDHELTNARKVCDEVFGESNFIACMVWEKGRKNDAKLVSVGHEYILMFGKSVSHLRETKTIWREEKPGAREIWEKYLELRKRHGDNNAAIESGQKRHRPIRSFACRLRNPRQICHPAAGDIAINQKSLEALKGAGDTPGIKALKEGAQVPGALKGTGSGTGPYGVPGGSKSGTGLAGGGTGTGTGGGSNTGLKGIPNTDYSQYLNQLKKRVESVWKYPDEVTGVAESYRSFCA